MGGLKTVKQAQAEKRERADQLAKIFAEGKDEIKKDDSDMIRLPNAVKRLR